MLRTKGIKVIFLFVVMLGSVSLFAQIEQPAAPAQAENISNDELEKFADVYQEMQMENQKAQQKMVATIKDEGLEVQRFNEIQEASMNPETKVDASEDEKKKHKAVVTKIKKLKPELESKMETIIKDSGLTIERYQALGSAIQSDESLQQKLQGIMMKKQTQG